MASMDGEGFGQIVRSRPINWSAAVACTAFAALSPELVRWDVLPAPLIAGAVATLLSELIWRTGLRPRLIWDGRGVTVVHPFRCRRVRWAEIAGIHEEGNLISLRTRAEVINWEFDHLWFMARLSRKYASRAGENQRRLMSALAMWSSSSVISSDPPGLPGMRRPLPLFLVSTAGAVVASILIFQL